MITRLICLANSHKYGGRCLAGLELNADDDIVRDSRDRPRWIRPIWPGNHGAIPFFLVDRIQLLDIVEIELTQAVPDGFQTENYQFNPTSLRVVGQYAFTTALLNVLTYTENAEILGNLGRSVSVEEARFLDHSLTLLHVQAPFSFYHTLAGPREKQQLRMKFCYERVSYDLSVTDSSFLETYRQHPDCLDDSEVYLCVSLGGEHQGAHYKLVAGILY